MKDNLIYKNLQEAMTSVQNQRAMEVGGHTWELQVERYGEAYLFIEIASITARLEQAIWKNAGNDAFWADEPEHVDRILDLCIDLGNYADFLYRSTLKRVKGSPEPE